ncbi:DUF2059 domain-containing protein [Noviherbaspirillum autotrophicum]|uniref:DUF2059 domain-containing protein n=1 Tax=Noviherbaspirillum autotrophicum TaxID=709839 RepID=A0A0C2BGX7_9BURK|nr:DUF2059 domain-containing protein [Noviherbaspirillum autotrophicum]KIF80500.1 hypothetical protein TSA66_06240 [Noviherbaspirillum autotrophicum]
MFKSAIAVIVVAASAAAANAAEPAKAAASPAKLELAKRVAQLTHSDAIAQAMLLRPVADAMQQSDAVLQGRVTADKQAAALKDIGAEAKKFVEENSPLVQKSAEKYIPLTVVPLLADRFTEDELRQIIAMLESPLKKKYEALLPEMEKALGQKVASDVGPTINPKLTDLKQRIGLRLRTASMP